MRPHDMKYISVLNIKGKINKIAIMNDAPLMDTGPVIAERRQTLVSKRLEFPEELLFKDANAEIFKVQSIDNIVF